MQNYYWNDWYLGWGWFFWIGMIFLIVSSFGNWGYTYRVHKRIGEDSLKSATDILNERYARGEIQSEEFHRIRAEIKLDFVANPKSEVSKQNFTSRKSPASF